MFVSGQYCYNIAFKINKPQLYDASQITPPFYLSNAYCRLVGKCNVHISWHVNRTFVYPTEVQSQFNVNETHYVKMRSLVIVLNKA